MWKNYHIPESLSKLLDLLGELEGSKKIIAGGTDLMVEFHNGKRSEVDHILDISRIKDLDQIWRDMDGVIHIQTLVTHNDVLRSNLLREFAFPLVQACYKVATPQIRNRATIIGNLVTASPANDTITPLMAMDAQLLIASKNGERLVPLSEFYKGVRKTVLEVDEAVIEVRFQGLNENQKGNFKKQALRKTQAISVLNCCILLDFEGDLIRKAAITMGSIAPTIVHAIKAEEFLQGKELSPETVKIASNLAAEDTKPISDVRASDDYRAYMMQVLVENGLFEIKEDKLLESVPKNPITLNSKEGISQVPEGSWDGKIIKTKINNQEYEIDGFVDGTLLNLVRERVGLTGTKVGCEEGECGACTLFLDGMAVVSCIIPAPRAHMASITTIEGLADEGKMHPVQEAFVEHGAVQCGYCTPGFVMSAAKMIEENPHPDRERIKEGISGNLCRCTGYYKIIEAIEDACLKMGE